MCRCPRRASLPSSRAEPDRVRRASVAAACAQIEACAVTPAVQAALNRDLDSAEAAGVDSTPSFFVNDVLLTYS